MSVPVRLAAFTAVLGLLLLAGLALGRAVGPVGGSTSEPPAEHATDMTEMAPR